MNSSRGSSDAFALIVDGKSLTYALEDDVKNMFLQLAVGCASVICCRSSPKQKALVGFYFFPFVFARFENAPQLPCSYKQISTYKQISNGKLINR